MYLFIGLLEREDAVSNNSIIYFDSLSLPRIDKASLSLLFNFLLERQKSSHEEELDADYPTGVQPLIFDPLELMNIKCPINYI